MPKKVLILTVPFGGGHYAAAEKIAALLHERDSTVDTKILDVITDGWPAFSRSTSKAYQDSTASNNAFWFKVYYRLTDRFPNPLKWFGSLTFMRYAISKLSQERPDLIICTFPFIGHVGAQARAKIALSAPIITIITDAGHVQGIWLTGHEDKILAATPDTVPYAKQRRLGADRIGYIGFPMNHEFLRVPERDVARHSLKLDPALFTVLVTSGGLGMSAHKMISLVRRLALSPLPFQLICIAGKNEQLKQQLASITFPSHMSVHIMGYVDTMPALMAASDIVCSKSGWLTISEALAVKRPLYLFDVIPGQERENAAYVVKNGYGVLESDPVVMAGRIMAAVSDPSSLSPMTQALAARDDEAAADRLGGYLLGLLEGHPV